MHVRDGYRTIVTSEPSRPFTFGVFKPGAEPGGATDPPKFCLAPPVVPQNFPRDVMPLHRSPTQTVDSSPCCKTGPSSGPPTENVWLRPCFKISHVHWWDKIPHVEICRRAGKTSLETILLRRQLKWLGHVIRMPGNRLTHRLLVNSPTSRRSVGSQKKRFKDHIKSSLSKCGILLDRLEKLARDLQEWRAVCDKWLATFEQQHIDVAVAKLMRRRQQRNQPPPTTTRQGSACTVCGRVCASVFGLRIHMRRHKETR